MTENHQTQNEIENTQTLHERRLAFGEILRSARNSSGCSINELSQSTRISRDFLIALEEGRFELLPGAIFARGFIRSLCKSLGIEAAPLVEAFDAAMGETVVKPGGVLQVPNGQRDVQSGLKKKRSASGRRGFSISSVDPRILASVGIAILICFGALVYSLQPAKVNSLSASDNKNAAKVGAIDKRSASKATQPVDVSSDPLNAGAGEIAGVDPAVAGALGERKDAARADSSAAKPSVPAVTNSDSGKGASVTANGASTKPGTNGAQVIQLVVKETMKVRVKVDKADQMTLDLKPDTYTYEFHDKADFMIYDAGSAELLFNGKSIGSLGSKGRIRRLSFRAAEPDNKKM